MSNAKFRVALYSVEFQGPVVGFADTKHGALEDAINKLDPLSLGAGFFGLFGQMRSRWNMSHFGTRRLTKSTPDGSKTVVLEYNPDWRE